MADVILYTNNAETLLATTINAAATSVVGSDCSAFPSPGTAQIFYVTLTDGVQTPEIIKVTARSTNTLTVVRAQEGTTAKSWTATSTTISVRITAASLNQFAQGALNSGNAKGANAIDYQASRSGATKVASGANSVALGNDNVASASYTTAIGSSGTASGQGALALGGFGATASGTDATAVGTSSNAGGNNSLAGGKAAAAAGSAGTALGNGTTASATSTTAVGDGATATANYASSYGYSADATGADSVAVGSGSAASTSGAVAVGKNAVASTQSDGTAVGSGAAATNYFATALGYGALASGIRAVAVGDATASGSDSVALGHGTTTASGSGSIAQGNGAKAIATATMALGSSAYARRARTSVSNFTRILSIDGWWTQAEDQGNVSSDQTIFSSYMDLTGGSTWATATSYNHGHVVKPTTPNGYQYWLWTTDYTSITTAGAEPTWPTTHGGSVAAGSGAYWICIDAANYVVTLATGVKFFPKSVGFIVEKYNTITVQPGVSFGESGSLTKYLASTTTTKLTAAYAIEEYTALASYVGGGSLAFKLQTAATGTQLLGRAFWTGKFVDVVT